MSDDWQNSQYMAGWKAGYHNATLAERQRINKLLQELEDYHNGSSWSPKYILDLINNPEKGAK